WKGLKPGIGASLSAGFVPEGLKSAYGSRVNAGFGVFLTLRPAAMMMHADHGAGEATPDHSEHTGAPAVDHSQHTMPAKPSAPAAAGGGAPSERPAEPRLPVIDAERVIDPVCAPTMHTAKALKATYQGRHGALRRPLCRVSRE